MIVGGSPISSRNADPAQLRRLGQRLAVGAVDGAGGVDAGGSPLAALCGGQSVDHSALVAAIGAEGCRALFDSGIAVNDKGTCSSPLRAYRLHGVVVFSDPDVEEDVQHEWYVDPLWEADLLLRLMLPAGGERALDMGCGSGVLSLVLAGRYDTVLGVDVNPRAVELSRLNATLNGVTNVAFEHGDMFSPAAGRYDRIVFNSPTNEEGMDFRDLLEAGEPILERFFREIPGKLADQGVVEVNLAMNDYPGDLFRDRLTGWLGLPDVTAHVHVLVSQCTPAAHGGQWKRGWVVVRRGPAGLTEIDWPYHDLYEGNPDSVTGAVEKVLAQASSAVAYPG